MYLWEEFQFISELEMRAKSAVQFNPKLSTVWFIKYSFRMQKTRYSN